MLGMHFVCCSPKEYCMNKTIFAKAKKIANKIGAIIEETNNPIIAAKNADVIYTDTWVSMGQEQEKEKRLQIFKPFQVNKKIMKEAKKDAIFMHDMPAYRGLEVTKEVIDGKQSVIFEQAENRLHAQKALLVYLHELFDNRKNICYDFLASPKKHNPSLQKLRPSMMNP